MGHYAQHAIAWEHARRTSDRFTEKQCRRQLRFNGQNDERDRLARRLVTGITLREEQIAHLERCLTQAERRAASDPRNEALRQRAEELRTMIGCFQEKVATARDTLYDMASR